MLHLSKSLAATFITALKLKQGLVVAQFLNKGPSGVWWWWLGGGGFFQNFNKVTDQVCN